MKNKLNVSILLMIILHLLVYTLASAKEEEKPIIGFKAPSFQLQGIDNHQYRIGKSSLNKPLILNFWASWCGPCQTEAPELEKLYQQYSKKVNLYAVNITSDDSIEGVEQFYMEHQLTFPILLDQNGRVTSKYQVVAVPSTYFINKDGIIIDKIIGYGGSEMIERKIEKLLK